ncbi:MAG: class I SAM-dependent methyltransferase [Candidatus Melainabacteria bacterium]|nr:class I SAM-dependent methyltransferase [Candidatus Melainabacteria bacterium]
MTLLGFIYKTLKKIAEVSGFNLVITKRSNELKDYEPISPAVTYAPWLSDGLFCETYKKIEKYTMVDKYKCYELWQLVEESTKLNGALIEVGVWRGGSGALIAKKAKLSGIKDKLCDTFTGVVKAGVNDPVYKNGEHADTSKETVEEVINKLKLDNTKILIGTFPEETGKFVSDKIFRFCHIDVDVYQSAKDIVEWLWTKLVVGGIVVFDDYGCSGCVGVMRFVNEERNKHDRLIIHNLNGHAVMVKLSD